MRLPLLQLRRAAVQGQALTLTVGVLQPFKGHPRMELLEYRAAVNEFHLDSDNKHL